MSETKINLESFIDEKVKENNPYSWYDFGEYYKDHNSKELKEFFKNSLRDFGEKILELAAENAEICDDSAFNKIVDTQSILDTINQVE